MMYDPEMPTPSRIFNMGPPKHAEKPMIGANTYRRVQYGRQCCEREELTATLMFATRSARELPTAKIVKPMIASDRPKTKPNVYACDLTLAGDRSTRKSPPEEPGPLRLQWP
jgi:hypothetical protein